MEIIAPAKINLYLNVYGKRDDGYHEIETLFQKISLNDIITINPSKNTCIKCSNPSIPVGPGTLMMKAVELFKYESGIRDDYNIVLRKNLPVGSGLGGGSSDAAGILKGLNEITGFPLKTEHLVSVSAGLGADVPFFASGASFAIGRGKGHIIEPINSDARLYYILVTPPFEVSTARIYSKVRPLHLTKDIGVDRIFRTFLREKDIKGIAGNLRNDLQEITLGEFGVLGKVFSELESAGALGTLLSGSGPTVFGIYNKEDIERALARLKEIFNAEDGWIVVSAETV